MVNETLPKCIFLFKQVASRTWDTANYNILYVPFNNRRVQKKIVAVTCAFLGRDFKRETVSPEVSDEK